MNYRKRIRCSFFFHVVWFSRFELCLNETAAWCMYGDQVPINLRAARKSTGSTYIYVLYVNPQPPLYLFICSADQTLESALTVIGLRKISSTILNYVIWSSKMLFKLIQKHSTLTKTRFVFMVVAGGGLVSCFCEHKLHKVCCVTMHN